MTVNLEDLAEEGASSPVPDPRQIPATFQVRLVRCFACGGHGHDPSKWASLWGGACWVCGGWGSRQEDAWKLRGPLAPPPSR
jgi:hypothetical protein